MINEVVVFYANDMFITNLAAYPRISFAPQGFTPHTLYIPHLRKLFFSFLHRLFSSAVRIIIQFRNEQVAHYCL